MATANVTTTPLLCWMKVDGQDTIYNNNGGTVLAAFTSSSSGLMRASPALLEQRVESAFVMYLLVMLHFITFVHCICEGCPVVPSPFAQLEPILLATRTSSVTLLFH